MPAVATASPESVTVGEVTVKVGDFFSSSWGYDQTNVDFYKVVGFTSSGKSVRLQKWSQASGSDSGHPSAEYVVAGGSPATYTDWSAVTPEMDYWEQQEAKVTKDSPVFTKRLNFYPTSVYCSLNSYSSCSLWDGKPEYQTASGWGH